MSFLEKSLFKKILKIYQREGWVSIPMSVEPNQQFIKYEWRSSGKGYKVGSYMLVAKVSESVRTTLFLGHDLEFPTDDMFHVGIGRLESAAWTYDQSEVGFTPFDFYRSFDLGAATFIEATAEVARTLEEDSSADLHAAINSAVRRVMTKAGIPDLGF
jgi:hypothetical protein